MTVEVINSKAEVKMDYKPIYHTRFKNQGTARCYKYQYNSTRTAVQICNTVDPKP